MSVSQARTAYGKISAWPDYYRKNVRQMLGDVVINVSYVKLREYQQQIDNTVAEISGWKSHLDALSNDDELSAAERAEIRRLKSGFVEVDRLLLSQKESMQSIITSFQRMEQNAIEMIPRVPQNIFPPIHSVSLAGASMPLAATRSATYTQMQMKSLLNAPDLGYISTQEGESLRQRIVKLPLFQNALINPLANVQAADIAEFIQAFRDTILSIDINDVIEGITKLLQGSMAHIEIKTAAGTAEASADADVQENSIWTRLKALFDESLEKQNALFSVDATWQERLHSMWAMTTPVDEANTLLKSIGMLWEEIPYLNQLDDILTNFINKCAEGLGSFLEEIKIGEIIANIAFPGIALMPDVIKEHIGYFIEGVVVDGLGGMIQSILVAIVNPIDTISGLLTILERPLETLVGIGGMLVDWGKEFWNADPEEKLRMLGKATFDIASLVLAVTGAVKAIKGGQMAASLADDVVGLSDDVVGLADDVAGLADDAAGLADDVVGLADDATALADMIKKASGLDDLINMAGSWDDLLKISGGFSGLIKQLGSLDDLIKLAGSWDDLVKLAGGFDDLVKAAGSFDDLVKAAGGLDDLVNSAGGMKNLLDAGASVDDLVRAGASMEDLMHAGASNAELADAVANNQGLRSGSRYTDAEIRQLMEDLDPASIAQNPLRLEYEAKVRALSEMADDMLRQGYTERQVAEALQQARRDLGIIYKDQTPQPLLDYIYERNLLAYGDPLGPSIDFLLRNKSYAQIIKSSYRPNKIVNALFAEFEGWLGRL